ncbi:AAA family ATPase [Thiocapsa rosea]|uniref:Putative ATPase n=1 Tax=Thiocapsa rosea TaxID=69360 RepID=A0A495V0F3_9GAMM|nr:hypothetical protein [Thiocapsa rosea]RKT42942.1 putative ATPase [Thiocapsa rosea]
MIRSLEFDGYRGFPCRRQYDRSQPFQRLDIAPLTLLIGRNNAGKTSVATLLYQTLGGLAGINNDALPLTVGGRPVAECFQDLLHARDLSAFLELAVSTEGTSGSHRLETILYLPGLLYDDPRPRARSVRWDGVDYPVSDAPLDGILIPDVPERTTVSKEAKRVLHASVWLGPLRNGVPEIPPRQGFDPLAPLIGPAGEGVIELLAEDSVVFGEVSAWLSLHAGLSLRWEKNLDLWRLQTTRGAVRSVPITQVGTGVHQLLPVLTLAKWRYRDPSPTPFIDVVQQPELHLHDALHPMLGDLFLDVARAGTGTTIVETHAEGLLLRIRRRIAEGAISPDLVALYYVDDAPGGSELRRIRILETGEVDYWPPGVFLESYEEVKALRRAQRLKEH